MNKINFKYLLAPLLIAGLVTGVNAQRDSRSRGGFDRGSRGAGTFEQHGSGNNNIQRPERGGNPQSGGLQAQPRFERGNMPQAGTTTPQSRFDRGSGVQRAETPQRIERSNDIQRDIIRNNRDNTVDRGSRNTTNWQRDNRSDYNRNNRSDYSRNDWSNYSRNNRITYSPRSYSSGRYSYNRVYIPSRHLYFGAPRYSVIPHGSISISFGGYPYYYNSGLFYNYYNGFYQPVFPPFGIRIGMLPYGYSPFYVGPDMYYYYNGIYYRQYDAQNYEVVDAPMGAQVSSLPKGAKSVRVNGEKFYELNGTYYKEDRDSKGRTVYTVVGKNGEIDNTDEPQEQTPSLSYKIGDVITDLPEGTRLVTINGEKLFMAPDETYFKQQVEGNTSTYKVVGFAEDNSSATRQME